MTSPTSSNSPLQSTDSAASQSEAASATQQAAASRDFAGTNGVKRQSSVSTAHNRTESLSNNRVQFLPAIPSLAGHISVNGNNAISNTVSFDHTRKPSVTISASGATGQLPNGGPMAGKSSLGNGMPVFGSMNASSPNMAQINLQTPGSLNPHSSNPRINSPQQSPSPIPQPIASGGRPPSSLQGPSNAVSFGAFGSEEPNRHHNPTASGMSTGSLTPNMASVSLRRESSQQSNSEMTVNLNGSRSGYHGGRGGRSGYQGNHISHQQGPYSPNPGYRQVNSPRTTGPNSQFTQGNRNLSYAAPQMQVRPSPSPSAGFSQPVSQGSMGMNSPGMAGQQPYYPPNMGQTVIHQFSFTPFIAQTQHKSFAESKVSSAQNLVSERLLQQAAIAFPTTLAPESGQFEEFLTLRQQGYFQAADGNFYPTPYTPYGMPSQMPQMQMSQPYYSPSSSRAQHTMTPQQPQFPQTQYGSQPTSMSRTPSGIGERSNSTTNQPPPTPMTSVAHHPNPSTNRAPPTAKASNFIVPKKTGGIKIVNPNTREELKIEKTPDSPAPMPSSKSPAIASTNPSSPSRTPESHIRTESLSIKNQSEIAKKFKADIENKLNAEKADAEKLKQRVEPDLDDKEQSNIGRDSTKSVEKVETAKSVDVPGAAETVNPENGKAIDSASPSKDNPTIIEPPKDDEREAKAAVTEEDDEYWAKFEAQELVRELEADRLYQEKKKLQDVETAKAKAEEDAKNYAELQRQEREAEAIDAEKQRKREQRKLEQGEGNEDDNAMFALLKKREDAFKATVTPAESSGVATPNSDVSLSMAPPPRNTSTIKSKPAALKLETSKQVEAPTPSAALQSLRSARFLTRLDDKIYPAAIASPNPALNSAAPIGKFRYDKNFLMQFQRVFTEKPSETWSDKIRETLGDADTPQTAKSGRNNNSNSAPRSLSTTKSMSSSSFSSLGSAMGAFAKGSTSEERFRASTRPTSMSKPYTMSHPISFSGGFASGSNMTRTASSSSMGNPQSPRNNPSRGGRGGGSRAGMGPKVDAKQNAAMPLTAGKDVTGLRVSEKGWKPIHVGQGLSAGPPPGGEAGYLAPDVVQRKVKSALNKMTPTTFDKISRQIIEIVMQSKQETDGRTLRQVIQLTFEKATDEAHWAQMYAEFCSRMLHSMTPEIKDETLGNDKNGNITAGNTLFRRYLLNRCQQDFEAGWKSKLPDNPEGKGAEAALLSDEYYAAAAAKRRGLGLVKFIGELYKLAMLTSRIMVMCVQRLLEYEGTPEEAEIESLSGLLNTIGEGLDNDEKARGPMNGFFQRIGDILKIEALPSRMRYMLLDLVDLRRANWKGKSSANKGPATIEQVHAQVRYGHMRFLLIHLIWKIGCCC